MNPDGFDWDTMNSLLSCALDSVGSPHLAFAYVILTKCGRSLSWKNGAGRRLRFGTLQRLSVSFLGSL